MFENKRSQFLSINVIIFFSGCTILFLISQLYSVLQVSLIMKGAGNVLLLSSVMTAMVVPRIFLLPVAGFLTDKAGVSRTLTGGTGILGILLVSLIFVNRGNAVNQYTVFIYAVLFGGISAAILPALYSAVPALVSGGNLQKANSIMQFISQGTLLAGPLFAGIVIEKMKDNAYVLMALAAIAALLLFSRVKYMEKQEQAEVTEESRASVQGSFKDLFKLPVLLLLLVFTAILNLCIIGPQQVGFPVVAMNCMPEGVDGYTKLLSMTGLGSLISAVIIGNMKRRENGQSIRLILWCSFALGIVWSVFSVGSSRLLILAAAFAAGLLLGIINVLFITVLQQLTPDFLVGRVMSLQFLCSAGLQPVSYMLTGVVLNLFSISQLYLMSGGSIILITIVLLVYSKKSGSF